MKGVGPTDHDFVQYVRRFRPSQLLPMVSELGSRFREPESYVERISGVLVSAWALNDIARVSIVHGNEFRAQVARPQDLLRLCNMYHNITDPTVTNPERPEDWFFKFFLRAASEQFPFQNVGLNSMARNAALFLHTTPSRSPTVLAEGWSEELFGCRLEDFVGVGQFLQIVAGLRAGAFDISILADPSLARVSDLMPTDHFARIMNSHYVSTIGEFQALNRPNYRTGAHRKYSFNPFLKKPFIRLAGILPMTPNPLNVALRCSTLGVYYAGIGHWGTGFATDVGDLFEQYVGRNLRLISGARVSPAIKYNRRQNESVDWILLTDNLVVLVEVKSTRATDPVRLGLDNAPDVLRRMLRRAFEQIEATSKLIEEDTAEFSHLDPFRRRVGLVVTLEELHVVNMPEYRTWFAPEKVAIPTGVISADELEHLVTLELDELERVLTSWFDDPTSDGWSLRSLLSKARVRRNPIIDAGFDANPWFNALEAVE